MSQVTTISTPYSAPKGSNNNSSSKSQVKSRPSLRRPKVAIVAAAEAEVAAAKATKASDSSLTQREEAEGAENAPAEKNATGARSKTGGAMELRNSNEDTAGSGKGGGGSSGGGGEDYSKLRCSSVTTEELAEREKAKTARRQNRCPDYPGLAFGAAMGFGSDTMMKFNIIKNELHNIMRSQLKRVDGEVCALSERIKLFDENLEKSEHYIKIATATLAEAVQLELERKEREGDDREDDSALSQFDAQMALLEGKLLQAQVLAQESAMAAAAASSSAAAAATSAGSSATTTITTPTLSAASSSPTPESASAQSMSEPPVVDESCSPGQKSSAGE